MAFPNIKQKIVLLDIEPNTKTLIEDKLLLGYQISEMVNLQPKYDKLLIVYTLNEVAPNP